VGGPSVSDLKKANQPIGSLDASQRDTSTSEPSTKGDSPPVGDGGKSSRDQEDWKRWAETSQAEWIGWELVMEGSPSAVEAGTSAASQDPAVVARQELAEHWKRLVDSMTSTMSDQELLASETMQSLSEGASGQALIEALDRDFVETLRDGAPWQAGERLAFLRQFQIALHTPANGMTHWISTTQLDSSGSEYRGQAIGLLGQVAQVDPSQRVSDAMLGEMEYRPWWMRPADGASQPWLIYLPDAVWLTARQSNPSFPETQEAMQGFGCRIEAIYLKRLAYRSKRGVDVVPVLIARRIEPEVATIAAGSPPSVLPSALSRSLPWPPWKPPGRELAALRTLGGVLGPLMEQLRGEVTTASGWYRKPEVETPPAEGAGTGFTNPAPSSLLAMIHQMDRHSDLVREIDGGNRNRLAADGSQGGAGRVVWRRSVLSVLVGAGHGECSRYSSTKQFGSFHRPGEREIARWRIRGEDGDRLLDLLPPDPQALALLPTDRPARLGRGSLAGDRFTAASVESSAGSGHRQSYRLVLGWLVHATS
jgi:hypothetical protein